jgi:hypothetical protein
MEPIKVTRKLSGRSLLPLTTDVPCIAGDVTVEGGTIHAARLGISAEPFDAIGQPWEPEIALRVVAEPDELGGEVTVTAVRLSPSDFEAPTETGDTMPPSEATPEAEKVAELAATPAPKPARKRAPRARASKPGTKKKAAKKTAKKRSSKPSSE